MERIWSSLNKEVTQQRIYMCVLHKGITFLSKYKVAALDVGRSAMSTHFKIQLILIAFMYSLF